MIRGTVSLGGCSSKCSSAALRGGKNEDLKVHASTQISDSRENRPEERSQKVIKFSQMCIYIVSHPKGTWDDTPAQKQS